MMHQQLMGWLLCLPLFLMSCQKKESSQDLLKSTAETQDPKKLRERLNKLMYWQIADELKLSPIEEKSLTQILETYQRRKEDLLKKNDELLLQITETLDSSVSKESKTRSDDYEKTQKQISELDVNQIQDLRKLLGDARFLNYLKIRKDLNTKLLKAIQSERD